MSGWVNTPLVEDWFAKKDPQRQKEYIYSVHPLNRIASSEEIGCCCIFSFIEASFITGVALPVDGAVSLGY